MLKRKATANH